MGFEVIYNLDFYFRLHYFPGCKPVATNHILSQDMSYFISTVFTFFQMLLDGACALFPASSPLHPFLSCFYQTHTFMLPSWLMKPCESATSLTCFSGPLILCSCFWAIALVLQPSCCPGPPFCHRLAFLHMQVHIPELSASLFGTHSEPV